MVDETLASLCVVGSVCQMQLLPHHSHPVIGVWQVLSLQPPTR